MVGGLEWAGMKEVQIVPRPRARAWITAGALDVSESASPFMQPLDDDLDARLFRRSRERFDVVHPSQPEADTQRNKVSKPPLDKRSPSGSGRRRHPCSSGGQLENSPRTFSLTQYANKTLRTWRNDSGSTICTPRLSFASRRRSTASESAAALSSRARRAEENCRHPGSVLTYQSRVTP